MASEIDLSEEEEAQILAWYPLQLLVRREAQTVEEAGPEAMQEINHCCLRVDDYGECYLVFVSQSQLLASLKSANQCTETAHDTDGVANTSAVDTNGVANSSPFWTLLHYCRLARQYARRHLDLFLTYQIPKYIYHMSWHASHASQKGAIYVMDTPFELFRAYRMDQTACYQTRHLEPVSDWYSFELKHYFMQPTMVNDCRSWSEDNQTHFTDDELVEVLERSGLSPDMVHKQSIRHPSLTTMMSRHPWRNTMQSMRFAKLIAMPVERITSQQLSANDDDEWWQHESLFGFVRDVIAPSMSRAIGMTDHYLELTETYSDYRPWVIRTATNLLPSKTSMRTEVFELCGLYRDIVPIIESYWLLPCQWPLYCHSEKQLVDSQ